MLRRRAYRFQIRPRGRAARLASWAAAARFVWNYFLAQREQMWRATRDLPEDLRREHLDSVSYFAQSKQLPALKAHKPFLLDCPAIALVQVLRDLDAAWQRFFSGLADRPRFKGRDSRRSITLSGEATFRIAEGGRRIIPAKFGAVSARGGRPPEGRPYRLTLSEDRGRWFASVGTELEVAEPAPPKGPPIGIDLGVAQSLTLSDGRVYTLPVATPSEEIRLQRLARAVSRRRLGSKRRDKAVRRLERARGRIARRVDDARHRITTQLASEHSLIVIEDLAVKRMSRSAAGTLERPGRNVRAKSGLNRSILAQGWAETRRQLTYKCEASRTELRAVAPARTSQRCSRCGIVDPASRRSQSVYLCTTCGHGENADANAAKNILALGTRALRAPSPNVKRGDPGASKARLEPRTILSHPDASAEVTSSPRTPLAQSAERTLDAAVTVLVGPVAAGARVRLRKRARRQDSSATRSQRLGGSG